jgi:two-component system nitrate/nitrite sensor histidine kinase NarX
VCSLTNCTKCLQGKTLHIRQLGDHGEMRLLSIPLRDMEREYGVMQLEIPASQALEEWQMQLLEALSRHIGIAIGTAHRAEQSHRLSLFEERGAIARELHDSLAQSLSYMKIQVSRLQSIMARQHDADDANKVLGELREGLNSAYRELRELLTTFRLKIEGEGLVPILQTTAREFSERSGVDITVESHMAGRRLSANEEIHVMQIVREALANVIHHAKARHAWVTIAQGADGSTSVTIDDDGIGLGQKSAEAHHYGMAIMQERAPTLHGSLQAQTSARRHAHQPDIPARRARHPTFKLSSLTHRRRRTANHIIIDDHPVSQRADPADPDRAGFDIVGEASGGRRASMRDLAPT